MESIILEYRFNNHQKVILSLLPALLIFLIFEMSSVSLNTKGFLFVFLCSLLIIFLIGRVFSSRGLIAKNNKLYIGVFYFKVLFFKKQIDLKEWTKISILKFNRRQKFAFFTSANPDLAERFNAFDVCLLNNKHTKRLKLISLKKEVNSQNAIRFLNTNFSLKYETYSPDFS